MNSHDIYDRFSLSRIHADWSCLVGMEYRLGDRQFREEAMAFACEIMKRARVHVLGIISQLQEENYSFLYPDEMHIEPGPCDWIRDLEQSGIYLPLSIAAWLREVGTVNLIGTHPSWPAPGYMKSGKGEKTEPLLADPLVVGLSKDYAEYLYREWKESSESTLTPFRVDIAPDHLHKANLSGGMPYQMAADRPLVDTILLNERHATSFVHYLRIAIQYAGFPGFDYIEGQQATWGASI